MRMVIIAMGLGVLLGLPWMGLAEDVGPAAGPDVQDIIDDRVRVGAATGIVVGIIRKDGRREFYSVGTMQSNSTTAVDEDTIFEIGSISKVFTTLMAAQMEAAGTLQMSDPVQQYLPEGVTMPAREGTVITLEHLATHTSGLPRLPDNFKPEDPANPYACYTYQQLYDFLSSHELAGPVGGDGSYSNLGTALLGHVLERRSGKSYGDLLFVEVCEPLGMSSTTTTPRESEARRVAGGHVGGQPTSAWDFPTFAGAGGIKSTARDMLVFTAANLGQIDTPMVDVMRHCHEPRVGTGRSGTRIGLGWHVQGPPGREITWHNGGTGGFASFLGIRKDTGEGVVVLSNSAYRGVDQVGLHLLDSENTLYDYPDEITIDPAKFKDYVGVYQISPNYALTVKFEEGRLLVELTGQNFLEVYPTATDEFSYRDVEARLEFLRGAYDQVDRLVLHQGGRQMGATKLE
ncbi:MAG: serine hydrolase [Phycisphaerales bacterium]|nr:serine hydrolase [Phycisphaerales bacterium]